MQYHSLFFTTNLIAVLPTEVLTCATYNPEGRLRTESSVLQEAAGFRKSSWPDSLVTATMLTDSPSGLSMTTRSVTGLG